eukprot:TRINITY_DN1404_c0_g1_i3.p1 TRINITY_DN1404_c0_g1~~TRINITY_DN1404_c0_g1_i3.p1  ORF type:complete len:263 (-),score=25.31 TRINITY_DN1404_c0_g1_i3:39-827(-)
MKVNETFLKKHTGNYDLDCVFRLDLSDEGISSIDGLNELCPNLTHLILKGNNLKDLTGIEGLAKLELLDLADNDLTSLAPLIDLPNLRTLHLPNNRLSSLDCLDPLSGLSNLRTLVLRCVTGSGSSGSGSGSGNPLCRVAGYRAKILGSCRLENLDGERLRPGSPKAPQNPLFAPKTDPEDEDFTIKIPPFQSWTLNLNLEMAEIGGKNGENGAKNGGKSAENGAKIALEREKFRAAAEEFKRAEKSARSVLEFYAQRGENL